MKIFTTEQIREIDRVTIEKEGVSSLQLIERVAEGVTAEVISRLCANMRIAVFAGPGNNGADALAVARMLAEQQIPTPGTLEYRRTGSTRRYHPGYECRWATNTVAHILENREYTGCLVNFKTEKVSYKVKQSKENPAEKQMIFENHHEPIIDRDTWERVQELRKQRKRLTAMMKWACSLACSKRSFCSSVHFSLEISFYFFR